MNWNDKTALLAALVAVGLLGGAVGPAAAATRIEGAGPRPVAAPWPGPRSILWGCECQCARATGNRSRPVLTEVSSSLLTRRLTARSCNLVATTRDALGEQAERQ